MNDDGNRSRVCRFFQSGHCKYGDQCRYEHRLPDDSRRDFRNDSRGGSRGNYQGNSRGGHRGGGHGSLHNRIGFSGGDAEQYQLDPGRVKRDLTYERPVWPFSVYSPGYAEPNMIEHTDFSPEELRFEYYMCRHQHGNDFNYTTGVNQMDTVMKQKVDEILRNPKIALRDYEQATKPQTERMQTDSGKPRGGRFGRQSGFSQSTGRFDDRTSGFGQPTGGFGQPAGGFGQPTSGFGQPGGFGQPPPQFPAQGSVEQNNMGFNQVPASLSATPSNMSGPSMTPPTFAQQPTQPLLGQQLQGSQQSQMGFNVPVTPGTNTFQVG